MAKTFFDRKLPLGNFSYFFAENWHAQMHINTPLPTDTGCFLSYHLCFLNNFWIAKPILMPFCTLNVDSSGRQNISFHGPGSFAYFKDRSQTTNRIFVRFCTNTWKQIMSLYSIRFLSFKTGKAATGPWKLTCCLLEEFTLCIQSGMKIGLATQKVIQKTKW